MKSKVKVSQANLSEHKLKSEKEVKTEGYIPEGVYIDGEQIGTSNRSVQRNIKSGGSEIIIKNTSQLNLRAIRNAMINVINSGSFVIQEKEKYINMLNIIHGVIVDDYKCQSMEEETNKKVKAIKVEFVDPEGKESLERIQAMENDIQNSGKSAI